MKRLLYILTSFGLLTACSSDNDELTPAGNNDERVPLTIVANIGMQAEGITRAVETSWEEGDKIGVYVTNHSATTPYTDEKGEAAGQNLLFTFSDGTNYETYGNTYRRFAADSKKIYLSAAIADVYGYYPYADSETLNPTAIDIDISDQTKQSKIDFMRANKNNVSNSNATIELLFEHTLTKLVFNLKQGESLLTDELKDATFLGMVIEKQYTTAKYNIYTKAFSGESSSVDIIPVKAASAPLGYVATFEAIVLPNGAGNPQADRTVSITFYQKDKDIITNKFKIPSSTKFESGHKYTYNVTVNATTIAVNTVNQYTEQW